MERRPPASPQPKTQPRVHQPAKGHEPTQHDLLRKDLPKDDVADGLEDFDGDEA